MLNRWYWRSLLTISGALLVYELYLSHMIRRKDTNVMNVSLYSHYSGSGVKSGLVAEGRTFQLNGRDLRIISGTIHYFRVHPRLWRDRLRKARAAGLNAIDTYVPWNLHEPKDGLFDFGDKGDDWSEFMQLENFIKMVKEEDLFLILRPGPYICAEWEFGGLPSWLLRDPNMAVRSTYEGYLNKAKRFIETTAYLVKEYQFSEQYGAQPIIMVQIENEFGSLGVQRQDYLIAIDQALTAGGLTHALHFTSDSIYHTEELGMVPGVFRTVNTKDEYNNELESLSAVQPNRPMMVTEFWTGWFDSWLKPVHNVDSTVKFMFFTTSILNRGASIGFYMFHGGTNFGFFNGALNNKEGYQPHVTSYDYGAPLTEDGNYTENYWALREYLLGNFATKGVTVPSPPLYLGIAIYPDCKLNEYLLLGDLLQQSKSVFSDTLTGKFMENLDVNNGNGQSYGFTAYSCKAHLPIKHNSMLVIEGNIRDIAYVIVNNTLLTNSPEDAGDMMLDGFWRIRNPKFQLNQFVNDFVTLTVLVENMGRVNYGPPENFLQNKGLGDGEIRLDGDVVGPWEITPLEFKTFWLKSLSGWNKKHSNVRGPVLLRGEFSGQEGRDAFINMRSEGFQVWVKGQLFVNGFNLGRYWNIGPSKTLYIPGPLVLDGPNEIMVFELFAPGEAIHFSKTHDLGSPGYR